MTLTESRARRYTNAPLKAGTQGIEPQSPGSEPSVIAVIPRPSSAGGSRTHTQLFLKQIALPVSVPRQLRPVAQAGRLCHEETVEEAGVEPAVSSIRTRWVTVNPFPLATNQSRKRESNPRRSAYEAELEPLQSIPQSVARVGVEPTDAWV